MDMLRNSGDVKKSVNESIHRVCSSVNPSGVVATSFNGVVVDGGVAVERSVVGLLFASVAATEVIVSRLSPTGCCVARDFGVCNDGIFSVNSSIASLNSTGTLTFNNFEKIKQDNAPITRNLVELSPFGQRYGVNLRNVCENDKISTCSPRDNASRSNCGELLGAAPRKVRLVERNERLGWLRGDFDFVVGFD